LQLVAGERGEAQRVVGGPCLCGVVIDDRDAQAVDEGGARLPVEGSVLEHRQGVEELAEPGHALDVGEAEVVVGGQGALLVLHAGE
jgi:hypothetical protein